MNANAADLETRVKHIVASALDVPVDGVHNHSSLINDLNAESIDFLDIMFRLESAFGIEIPESDLWRGSIDVTNEAAIAAGVEQLRARMPEFGWERLPAKLTRADLPALITVQTIVDYMRRRVEGTGPA